MEIRDYKNGDENRILELFEIVFGKPMQRSYWKWRFDENPAGKHMIKLMWENDLLIGHYAVSPVMLRINYSKVLSALSMTTMTHPEYGGKGIFGLLANAIYDKLENELDAKAIWGFPNNNSHYGFIKNLGWSDLSQVVHLASKPGRIKPVLSDQISRFDCFDNDHSVLMQELTSSFPVAVVRDDKYLNWRYVTNPTSIYDKFEFRQGGSLLGFMVVKTYPSSADPSVKDIYITETGIPASNAALIPVFLSHIFASYGQPGATVYTWMNLFDRRYIQFEKAGFEPGGKSTYLGVRANENLRTTLDDYRNWYISYGDSDVY